MLNLKNKFILAPIKLGYCENNNGMVVQRHLAFYKARAKSLGAVIPEPLYIDKGLRELPSQLGIDSEEKMEGLRKLTDLLHETDTKAIAHLNHPGRMANPKIPRNYFVSSTDKPCEAGGAIPKALSVDEIFDVIKLYHNAALRAEKCGFDIIELQFGHGYLPAQFMSPLINNRKDGYGGNFENRIKLALEIFDSVKLAVHLPIIVRISGDEMLPGGIKLDEMIRFAEILDGRGVEAIHVSAGTVCSTPPWYFQHMFVPKGKTWELANKIKQNIHKPVIYVGQINEHTDINNLEKKYNADYIAIGRALVADPEFIGKYLNEVKGVVRPCLACSDGCLGGVKSGKGLGCLVNPKVGKEEELFEKTINKKNIVVVGGGLAGAEAALTLKRRGHTVTLFEQKEIGGQFNLAYLPPKKQSLQKLTDYYKSMIKSKGIKLIQKSAVPDDLIDYDAVILATGSKPAIPHIKGLKEYYWAEVLLDENLPENKNVAVIGGGLIGVEIAHKLEVMGNKVYIIEMLDEIARGMEMIEKKLTLNNFKNANVNIFLNARVTKIVNDKVFIEGESFKNTLENIDIIILSTGMKSYNPLKDKIENKHIYVIGDAKNVGKAQDAIRDGYETSIKL